MTSTAVNLGSGLIGTLLTTWRPAQDSHVPRPVTSYHGLPCQRNIGLIVVIQSPLDPKTSCFAESLDGLRARRQAVSDWSSATPAPPWRLAWVSAAAARWPARPPPCRSRPRRQRRRASSPRPAPS